MKNKLIELARGAKEQRDKGILEQAQMLNESLNLFSEEEKIKYFIWDVDKQWEASGYQRKLEALAKKFATGEREVIFYGDYDNTAELEITLRLYDYVPDKVIDTYMENPKYGMYELEETKLWEKTGARLKKQAEGFIKDIVSVFSNSDLYDIKFKGSRIRPRNILVRRVEGYYAGDYDAGLLLSFDIEIKE